MENLGFDTLKNMTLDVLYNFMAGFVTTVFWLSYSGFFHAIKTYDFYTYSVIMSIWIVMTSLVFIGVYLLNYGLYRLIISMEKLPSAEEKNTDEYKKIYPDSDLYFCHMRQFIFSIVFITIVFNYYPLLYYYPLQKFFQILPCCLNFHLILIVSLVASLVVSFFDLKEITQIKLEVERGEAAIFSNKEYVNLMGRKMAEITMSRRYPKE